MNVLLVASWYPNVNNEISGVFIREHALALKSVGVNVIVLFPFEKELKPNAITSSYEDDILTYRANTDYMRNSKLSRINSIKRSRELIHDIVNSHAVDIIHAHICYSAGFMAAFYKRKYNMPYVITEHMSYIDKYNSKFYNRLMFKYAYSKADRVIPVSTALEKAMRVMGFRFESSVVGNAINMETAQGVTALKPTGEYNIVFVGLMSKNRIKGLEYLLPAFKNYVSKNPDINIKLHLVGDGELIDEYKQRSRELKIDINVNFHGKLTKHELLELMSYSNFLVVSSLKETFGSVIIEALASGIPVLSTRCGGPEDIINDRVGILVDAKSIQALEEGIEKMITSLDKFDSDYIRRYVSANYSEEIIGHKIKNIYEDILKK